ADRVGIASRRDGEIRFSGIFKDENLCVRAARLLKTETSVRHGCDLALEKAIPIGGGLGGGSSDAATVLVTLNRLWKTGLTREDLMLLGARLGADVPVFVFGRNAVGEGIGDRLTAIDLPPAWYVVIVPQVSVSTKETFASALTSQGKRLKIPP